MGEKEKPDWYNPDHEPKTKRKEFVWTDELREEARRIHALNQARAVFDLRRNGNPVPDADRRLYRRFTNTFGDHGTPLW